MSRYRFIVEEKAHYSVAQLCRVLQVAASGYYAWRHRKPSRRALTNAAPVRRASTPTCRHASSASPGSVSLGSCAKPASSAVRRAGSAERPWLIPS